MHPVVRCDFLNRFLTLDRFRRDPALHLGRQSSAVTSSSSLLPSEAAILHLNACVRILGSSSALLNRKSHDWKTLYQEYVHLRLLCKRPARLSITHKFGGVETEFDIGEPGDAAPHDSVAGGRITAPGEVAAKSGYFDDVYR